MTNASKIVPSPYSDLSHLHHPSRGIPLSKAVDEIKSLTFLRDLTGILRAAFSSVGANKFGSTE